MGFTGFFLIFFLIFHAGANSTIFLNDKGETFNAVAHFLSHNYIMRIFEVGLFVGIILHIIQGLLLVAQNNKARPIKYYSNKPEKNSKWYSRSMGLLGTLLLLFLVMHLSHFWIDTKVELYGPETTASHSMYLDMKETFSQWYWVLLYMVGLVALFYHLLHGFQSAFQTFGLNNKRWNGLIRSSGLVYAVIICVLFALMPLAFYFGWIQ